MTNIWQEIIQTNTFNFIIVFLFLIFLIKKFNIKQHIETLKDEIKFFVEKSTDEKNKAEKELNNIKDKIVHLPEELENINKSAVNSVEKLSDKVEADIKEKMNDINISQKRIMNLETKKFKSNLSSLLSEASINLAKDNALSQLKNNRELHNKYINDAINEIDRIDL